LDAPVPVEEPFHIRSERRTKEAIHVVACAIVYHNDLYKAKEAVLSIIMVVVVEAKRTKAHVSRADHLENAQAEEHFTEWDFLKVLPPRFLAWRK
jgi:hypothetical protein